MALGGRHDKDDVRRRLLQDLQQRIERRSRQHVDFIDDENLVTIPGRRIPCVLTQLADIVDAGIGGGVDLEHIHALARGDLKTGRALITRCYSRSLKAIQTFGKDSGGGCLANSTRSRKQIGMPDAVHLDGILEGLNDRLLTNDILEYLRPELSGNDLILHRIYRGSGPGVTASHWGTRYRCFLPDLAGFAGSNCAAPRT